MEKAIQFHLLNCGYGSIDGLLQPWADPFGTCEGYIPI